MTGTANKRVAPPKNGSDLHSFGTAESRALEAGSPLPILVDIQSVSRSLGISMRQVRRFVAEGEIPYVRVGQLIRFDPDDVRSWIDERRSPPGEI